MVELLSLLVFNIYLVLQRRYTSHGIITTVVVVFTRFGIRKWTMWCRGMRTGIAMYVCVPHQQTAYLLVSPHAFRPPYVPKQTKEGYALSLSNTATYMRFETDATTGLGEVRNTNLTADLRCNCTWFLLRASYYLTYLSWGC